MAAFDERNTEIECDGALSKWGSIHLHEAESKYFISLNNENYFWLMISRNKSFFFFSLRN